MTFFNKDEAGEYIDAGTERAGFVTWLNDAVGKCITHAIRAWGVTGRDGVLIGEAWELYDKSGENGIVGHEIALIAEKVPADKQCRKRAAFNAVLKQRMDGAPAGKMRNEPNSTAFWATAHSDMKWQSVSGADPGQLFGPAMDIRGNPGATLNAISADMLVSMGGQPCAPLTLDGQTVGLPIMQEEPPTVAVKAPDGASWFAVYDYGHRQQGLLDGTGSFIPFRSRNAAGEWGDWAMLNGGLIDRTKGREQGDMDVLWYVDGQINGAAGVGNMTHAGGPPAGWVPILDSTLNLGNINNRWLTAFITALDMPVETKRLLIDGQPTVCQCVRVGDRWMPTYQEAP